MPVQANLFLSLKKKVCPSDSQLHTPFYTLLFLLNSRSQDLFQSLSVQRILLFGGAIISLTSALLTDIQVISKLSLLQNTVSLAKLSLARARVCVCVCVCVCVKEKFLKELVDGGVHF